MLAQIAKPNSGFAWPAADYLMTSLCVDLQPTGCCAYTFQRVGAAYLMATCRLEEAAMLGDLVDRCQAAGATRVGQA